VWLDPLGVRLIKVWGSWVARPKPWEVSEGLRAVIEPLLPKVERRSRYPGRKRLDDRLVLRGILFVLHTGIAWEHLPPGAGLRLGDDLLAAPGRVAPGRWVAAAARGRAREAAGRGRARFSRAVVDSWHVRALKGGRDGAKSC
jgi:hypothetical protein